MKGLFWFFCGFTVFTSTQIQEGSSTFKVGRILDMPLAIRGITPKDLRAIHKEVGDKTWEDIRHLFVIKPTQALLNLLQVPLAKDKLVILPQKGQEEMSLVNVMVEETPTTGNLRVLFLFRPMVNYRLTTYFRDGAGCWNNDHW